jgi:DNA polymerase-3 subunit delta'
MKIKGYIENKQPLLFRTFSNALNNDRLAHAYLVIGEAGTPLKETALYLAESILCDHPNPLADEECLTCRRIQKEEYPDVVLLDGSEGTIKKDQVETIVANFQKTALESKGIMVYIIHQVENMTVEAVNSLLKFLEEPASDTYAILTCQNEAKVLPTIISRCETLRLLLLPREEVIKEAVSLGAKQEDAEILSNFYNDGQMIKDEADSDDFQKAKTGFVDELDALNQNPSMARYVMEKTVTPLLNDKPSARFYFDMLSIAFQDIVSAKIGNPIKLSAYANIISDLAKKLPHVESSLLAIMTLRSQIELNLNTGLLLSHLVVVITKE